MSREGVIILICVVLAYFIMSLIFGQPKQVGTSLEAPKELTPEMKEKI